MTVEVLYNPLDGTIIRASGNNIARYTAWGWLPVGDPIPDFYDPFPGYMTESEVATALTGESGLLPAAVAKAARTVVAADIGDAETDIGVAARAALGTRREISDVPLVASSSPPDARPITRTWNPNPLSTRTSTTTSWIDVQQDDGTKLRTTVVVPASGKVALDLTASCRADSGGNMLWGLHDGTNDLSYTALYVAAVGAPESGIKTASVEVNKDSAGNPLVPGNTLTLQWRQRLSSAGSGVTRFGVGIGPAMMKALPVSNRITDIALTPTVAAAVDSYPLWLCHDRQTFLGGSSLTSGIYKSTDDAATWTRVGTHNLGTSIAAIRELDNGEILVVTNPTGSEPAKVYTSTGWATDQITATFTLRLTAAGGATASISGLWSISVYGPIIVIAEYGPKVSASNMARYVYLSTDFGLDFAEIFDLVDFTGETVEAHMHGVAYDPWWNALWVCYGDSEPAWGSAVSFDMGRTWTALPKTQKFTTIFPMEKCILFLTDRVGAEGVWRIPRTSKDRLVFEQAHVLANTSGTIAYVGTGAFQSRAIPDAPVTLAFNTGGVSGAAKALATYDGYAFREVWNDSPNSYVIFGLQRLLGPTTTGKYVGRFTRDASGSNQVTLTP